MYLAPQNIPHAIVMTNGNKVVLYCIVCGDYAVLKGRDFVVDHLEMW